MNGRLEGLIAAARERPVPWDATRSQRVFSNIGAARARSRRSSIAARLALGSVASAALLLCVARLSTAIHHGTPSPSRFPSASAKAAQGPEEVVYEPSIGDGGYEAREQRR
jgi:hypothetical protein